VVAAAQKQLAELNTNTRYLYPSVVAYAERLRKTLPPELDTFYFVCSGSEATDLALRLARSFTKQRDVVCVDHGYHGHTGAVIEVSPYKFNGPGGEGRPEHTQVAEAPDLYRGRIRSSDWGDEAIGAQYAESVRECVGRVRAAGRGVAGFICESVQGCAGQVPLPAGYLRHAYAHVRAAGGVCIADEVQTGFGRVGSHFWAFQTQGVGECDVSVRARAPLSFSHRAISDTACQCPTLSQWASPSATASPWRRSR
jgi:4-aminobutyrate aminotransferase-like enzyme